MMYVFISIGTGSFTIVLQNYDRNGYSRSFRKVRLLKLRLRYDRKINSRTLPKLRLLSNLHISLLFTIILREVSDQFTVVMWFSGRKCYSISVNVYSRICSRKALRLCRLRLFYERKISYRYMKEFAKQY